MTSPTTPGDAITRAAARIGAQREATRELARSIAEERLQQDGTAEQPPQAETR